MAKCKYCGAEVTIGERCTYCGSKAESWYYPVAEKKQEPKKKKASHNRVRDQNGNSWSWVNRPLGYSDYPVGYGNYWEYLWGKRY